MQALRRELAEEIGLDVASEDLERIGTFTARAANEPEHDVHAEVFRLGVSSPDHLIGAEIAESRWIHPRDPGNTPLAPLAIDQLMPLLLMSEPGSLDD